MGYGNFKDFPGRTIVDKVLQNKEFDIAKNSKYCGYKRGHDIRIYLIICI